MTDKMAADADDGDVKRKLAQMADEYARLLSLLDMAGGIAKMMRFYAFEEAEELWSGENESFGASLLDDGTSGEEWFEKRRPEDSKYADFRPMSLPLAAVGKDIAAVKVIKGSDTVLTRLVWPRAMPDLRSEETGRSAVIIDRFDAAREVREKAWGISDFEDRAVITADKAGYSNGVYAEDSFLGQDGQSAGELCGGKAPSALLRIEQAIGRIESGLKAEKERKIGWENELAETQRVKDCMEQILKEEMLREGIEAERFI